MLATITAGALLIGACAPESGPPASTTTTTIPEPSGPTISGQACQPSSGVTVVVDFTALDNSVKIGCAPGAQANGLAALSAAGFVISSESGPGTVCRIDGLPTQGYPYCWLEGNYWSYWRAPNRSSSWTMSMVGAGSGPLAAGSVEGWSWAPASGSSAPRVSVADLAAYTPALPACAVLDAPVLSIIDDDETLTFASPDGSPVAVAALPATADPAGAVYQVGSTLPLTGLSGPTRVLARSAATDCQPTVVFDAVYDVRATYTGRPGLPGSDSNAVEASSSAIKGWASGYVDYLPGADVTVNLQTPQNAVGPYTTSQVVLGNGGRITMTFATPIADGPGDDLAVFENGFNQSVTSELLFTELAYVEVSSNGRDFVRFDSASRQPVPVAAFGFQDPRLLGGLAGKDPAGWGTAFDLSALANKAAVRSGLVDLSAITHVRLVDVVGAADYPNPGDTYLDSFGRQIFDAHKTTGSGGFDLRAVAALN